MSRRTIPLNHVKVASPCPARWDEMVGTERVRFCGQCSLNVYNLSEMTKREAERLIAQTEGRLCIRYYRRADGTILTKNCPVGLRALKTRVSRFARASASAALTFVAGILAAGGLRTESPLWKVAQVVMPQTVFTPPEPSATTGAFVPLEYEQGGPVVGALLEPQPRRKGGKARSFR